MTSWMVHGMPFGPLQSSGDEDGWSAEIRIPLSQIRYEASDDPQTWGINFFRRRVASAEESYYALLSKLRERHREPDGGDGRCSSRQPVSTL